MGNTTDLMYEAWDDFHPETKQVIIQKTPEQIAYQQKANEQFGYVAIVLVFAIFGYIILDMIRSSKK